MNGRRLALYLLILLPPAVGIRADEGVRMGRPLRVPFVLDCGPSDAEAREREELERREREERGELGELGELGDRRGRSLTFLHDRRYSERAGYGYEGGEGFRHWFAVVSGIWGAGDAYRYHSGRSDPGSYRFRLPAGYYIVTLGFCEIVCRLPGERVFDIHVQGEEVAEAVDLVDTAGFAQAVHYRFPATVRGREGLSIALRRRGESRSPFVNAIWVERRPESRRPRAPGDFRGFGSYGMNVLFWDHPDDNTIVGYQVERRRAGAEKFERTSVGIVRGARWIDTEIEKENATAEYRVRAINIDGRTGAWSESIRLEPRALAQSTLPVYGVQLSEEAWRHMLREPTEDHWAAGWFRFKGGGYPIRMRVRGASTRFGTKLSFRIRFKGEKPFPDRKTIYLKAEPNDHTLQQEKLTCDVFTALQLPVSGARYCNLIINGRYQGVYLDIDRVDSDLIRRAGYGWGNTYRAASFQQLGEPPGEPVGSNGRKRYLREFVRRINQVERGEFANFLDRQTIWPVLRDYWVASVICHRSEIEANDYFYFRQAESGRWLLVPWDHNNGNWGVPSCGRRVRRPFMSLFGQTIQGIGAHHDYWYVLASRMLHQESLRKEYLARLERWAREWLLSPRITELVNANYRRVVEEVTVDPFRWPPGDDEPFHRSPAELVRFARRHGERLLRLIEAARRRPEPAVVINEFQLDSAGSGWVEVLNRSSAAVALRGFYLADLGRHIRRRVRLPRRESLAPGALKVVQVPPREAPPAARERELPSLERRTRTVALFGPRRQREGRNSDDDDRDPDRDRDDDRHELYDWCFFGPQPDGFSYGRAAGGFGYFRPTPGAANPPRPLAAPPYLTDTTNSPRHGSKHCYLRARLPADLSETRVREIDRIDVHYSFGDKWEKAAMTILPAAGAGSANSTNTAKIAQVKVPQPEAYSSVDYYFEVRTKDGVYRRAPFTAPDNTYSRRLKYPD